MTRWEAIAQISRLLKAHKHCGLSTPGLYTLNHRLCILPGVDHPKEALLIIELSHHDLANGLTSETWNLLEGKMQKLIKEKVL